MLRDLGQAVVNVCRVVPDGVVLFFPSYAFMDAVVSVWMQSGHYALIDKKKKIVSEK
jgi:Rad3-related DNA helicase